MSIIPESTQRSSNKRQRELEMENAQLRREKLDFEREKEYLKSESKRDRIELGLIEREVSEVQLRRARAGGEQALARLRGELVQEQVARQSADSDIKALREKELRLTEELDALKASRSSQDANVKALQTKLKAAQSKIAGLSADYKVFSMSAEAILQKRVSGIPALALPAHITHPCADYFNFAEVCDDPEYCFEVCWRGGDFVPYCGPAGMPKYWSTEFLLGRPDHSPGFPLIPGRPGTVITQDASGTTTAPITLGVLIPEFIFSQGGALLWRYLGEYDPESDWERLGKEEWKLFAYATRQNWCSYLVNPDKKAPSLLEDFFGEDWENWKIAARISLRKAKLPLDDPDLLKKWATEMAEGSRPCDVTPKDVNDALSKGEEFLYVRTLRPVGFDMKFYNKLKKLEAARIDSNDVEM